MTEQELLRRTKQLIIEGGLMSPARVEPLRDEAKQITAIMAASRNTLKRTSEKLQIANRKLQIPT